MELKTPLYDCHVAGGGKIVPFAGYLLPDPSTEQIIFDFYLQYSRKNKYCQTNFCHFLRGCQGQANQIK